MPPAVIITTKDLRIVEATHDGRELPLHEDNGEQGNLLDRFPAWKPVLTNELLEKGGWCTEMPAGGGSFRVQVLPAGTLIVFILHEKGSPGAECSHELELEGLRKHKKLLETIIEDAPVGLILLNEDGTILYINKKQEENTRKKRELLIDHNIRTVYRRAFEHADVVKLFNKLISSTDPNGSAIVDHYYPQFYKRDMIIKFLGKRLPEHKVVALFVEIEDELYREKRRAEKAGEELRMSRSYLAQLLDASPNMVISVDGKKRVVSFNKTAERLLGFHAREVYNSPVDRFFPKEELPKLDLAVSSQVLFYSTFHIFRADRTSFPIDLYSTKIRDDRTGKDIATLLLAVNIEENNRLRKNLIQSQKMNFIGELVSGLAHQLNNPLVGVVNIADVLLRMIDENDEKYPYVKMIKDAGESCRDVVSRLLRFSRKQEESPRTNIDIRHVLEAGIDMLVKHPKFRGIRVERSFEDVPLLRGDPVLLQQAFMNILFNSAQAVDGSGSIRVECGPDRGLGRQVMVAISDNGCGIPEEDIPRVFEPFFSTKEADDGTGIGLSLAYWIIQDHGGMISVESTPGQGSTFTTYLPLAG
ncbi:MAG TPA: ATP-binding protein [Deltaproteobacteria bacterium]|nr:ATP-binding protein [Deltaproteobacteria bacterium]